MTQDSRRFLPPEALNRISRLEILARNVVEGFLAGMHRSPYFGQSLEFVQHREYVPGDDIRRIDWKAWSKTDKYYIKQYEEETNLRTRILLDLSESMSFQSGKISKADYASSITACLSYLMIKQQDAVGVTVFDDEVRATLPIRSQQTHLHTILSKLHLQNPGNKTNIYQMLQRTTSEFSRRGLVILVSDLLADRDGLFKGLRYLRMQGHDVMVFHVMDDQELDFNFTGTTRFVGMEEMGELTCDPKALRQGYLDALNNYLHEIKRTCASMLVDYQVVRSSEGLDAVLSSYMKKRVGFKLSA